jgi:hypothetical protein
MTTCEICGTEFDERGVQIVVPEIAKAFDRVECAVRGRALSGGTAAPVFTARHATFVEVTRDAEARSYGLSGLPAGLAAALGGTRTRVALGGASAAAVALLVATAAHLSLRSGGATDELASPTVFPSTVRYGAHDRPPTRAVEARVDGAGRASTVADDDAIRLVAYGYEASEPLRTLTTPHARTAAQKPTATKHSRKAAHVSTARTTRKTSKQASVSTRPGWGHGDKNHVHSGPAKASRAKSQGRRK